LAFSFSAITMAVANSDSGDDGVSVLAMSVIQDNAAPPVAPVAQDPVVPVAPVPATGDILIQGPSVVTDSVMMGQPMGIAPVGGCQSCCATPCCCKPAPRCCPPPPKPVVFCLQDPCGCTHKACVTVPACCACEQPCITWRNGIFGRQIATLCWKCCDHEVKVTISRKGRVRVRG
jgi:hypothetical protein